MTRSFALRAAAVSALALCLLATWPQLLGLQRTLVFAQLTALRGLLVLAALTCALVVGVIVRRPLWRRGFGAVLVVGFLAVAALNVAVMASRGLGSARVAATSVKRGT